LSRKLASTEVTAWIMYEITGNTCHLPVSSTCMLSPMRKTAAPIALKIANREA
jgi:hypothetical protein